MKQLKDGGVAFYLNSFHFFKISTKIISPLFTVPLVLILLGIYPPTGVNRYTLFWGSLSIFCCIIALVFGLMFLIQKSFKDYPSCIVYGQYITWKDGTNCSLKEVKLFFEDLQSFFIINQKLSLDGLTTKQKVICFANKDPQTKTPFYPYYALLSEQDQKLLIGILQDKGLTHLPGDCKPN